MIQVGIQMNMFVILSHHKHCTFVFIYRFIHIRNKIFTLLKVNENIIEFTECVGETSTFVQLATPDFMIIGSRSLGFGVFYIHNAFNRHWIWYLHL